MFGSTNATVAGYGSSATVNFAANSAAGTIAGNVLNKLEQNGSVSSFVSTNTSYEVLLANMSAYALQSLLYNRTGSNTLISVNASSLVKLPKAVFFKYASSTVPVYPPNINYTITVMPIPKMGAVIPVSVQALITNNGTVYNGQIRIKPVA